MAIVTSVIPVYNGEKFLPQALEMFAGQTRRPDRLVVLDNCSTDATPDIARGFKGMPCEWRRNETNIGLLGNLNRALTFSSETEYLHILPVDDRIKPEFFQRMLPLLEDAQGSALAYSLVEIIDGEGNLIASPQGHSQGAREVQRKEYLGALAELKTILMPGIIMKTMCQPSTVQFMPDMPQVGDCLFYARWGAHCTKLVEMSDPMCQHRRHAASTTDRNILNLDAWVKDEWRTMILVMELIEEGAFDHWMRWQKLKCLFAARSRIKIDMVSDKRPGYAAEIRKAALERIPTLHWRLGNIAVSMRDLLHGKIRPHFKDEVAGPR